jgi:hypothetical protein
MTYINRRTGLVVTVLSETPTVVTFSVKGGGFVCRLPKLLFQADFEPAQTTKPTWRKGRFGFDSEAEYPYVGYTHGQRWNGWECPWFELDEAQQIVADCPHTGSTYNPDKDCFEQRDYADDEVYALPAQSILVDGKYIRVYIVVDGWCWEEWRPRPEARPELAFIKEPIVSEQAAKNYLRQLHRAGFAFHPEDDPIDIERSGEPLFNGAEMEHLAARQAELFKHLQDPCAYALFVGMGFQAYGRESDAASTPTWQELVNLEVGEQLPAYPNLWIRRIS